MKLRAEVRCYMCARSVGSLEWNATNPSATATLRPHAPGTLAGVRSLRDLRCPWCGGQTHLEEIEEVRVVKPIELFPVRRGRPRKNPVEAVPA